MSLVATDGAIHRTTSTPAHSAECDRPPCTDGSSTERFSHAVDQRLEQFLSGERNAMCAEHSDLAVGLDALIEIALRNGKRIRSTFAHVGFFASGGGETDRRIVDLAASIELLHTFALIHDDVMDDSETRRHAPTLHRQFKTYHTEAGWRGEQRRVAESFAILLGDLAFALSIKLQRSLPDSVIEMLDTMRTELHIGQFLDLLTAADGEVNHARIQAITLHKTAKYTVQRPLQLGALLAGNRTHLDTFTVYGEATGEAFQHRDDLIGVFGDPGVTGKPRFDDLFGAKATLLLHHARTAPGSEQIRALDRIGTIRFTLDDAQQLADYMVQCGAHAAVEERITSLTDIAVLALERSTLSSTHRQHLTSLVHFAGHRRT